MGTAVASESGVTSLEVQDFYLVAHKALQGTSKPLRYILLAHGWAVPDKNKSVPKEYEMTEGVPTSLPKLTFFSSACRVADA